MRSLLFLLSSAPLYHYVVSAYRVKHAQVLRFFLMINRLVGLVVKASASRAEDPGFEFRLRRDFFEVESYQ